MRHSAAGPASRLPSYIVSDGNGCRIRVHVQPRAKTAEIGGRHGDRLKLRVTAPPADGAANAACIEALAQRLGVRRSAVTLVRGARSPAKDFAVAGLTPSHAAAALEGSQG